MHIDATGIMRSARLFHPKPIQGPATPAARLRLRIAIAEAVLKAGAASEGSDPAFRAGCTRMLEAVLDMRTAWVSAFGFDWETGAALPHWQRPRTSLVPLLQRAYVCESQMRGHKPWVEADGVVARIAHAADEAMRSKPTVAQVEAARKERDRVEHAQRAAAAEARRQEDDLVSFRAGTLRQFRFPNERVARARTASRWG